MLTFVTEYCAYSNWRADDAHWSWWEHQEFETRAATLTSRPAIRVPPGATLKVVDLRIGLEHPPSRDVVIDVTVGGRGGPASARKIVLPLDVVTHTRDDLHHDYEDGHWNRNILPVVLGRLRDVLEAS
jgi:hypothetical protein